MQCSLETKSVSGRTWTARDMRWACRVTYAKDELHYELTKLALSSGCDSAVIKGVSGKTRYVPRIRQTSQQHDFYEAHYFTLMDHADDVTEYATDFSLYAHDGGLRPIQSICPAGYLVVPGQGTIIDTKEAFEAYAACEGLDACCGWAEHSVRAFNAAGDHMWI